MVVKPRFSPSPLRRRRGSLAHKAGLEAEKLAEDYIHHQGFTILARRYRTAYGEIDLLAADDDYLLAIEVKQRTTLGEARYAVSTRQSQRLLRAFQLVIETHPEWQRENTRFDVIIIDIAGEIDHIRDALRLT
ncbi:MULTISPECIES: YraN family protein [Bombella]|uniref:UPF0102 protein NQF89_05600 n=1 Tax=Bombella pollinis TaxID=2967337 RepID=A0ABT3WLI4_9PROT|nr:YraN family protein [Bombella pollinis]MCT6856195.1 YraN family protein [Bombella apis]MCX5619896.1 YraN family protein [Bombella pollinis]MUG90100.1 DUF91 domain-containing protein [Bombella sp. ESL0385]